MVPTNHSLTPLQAVLSLDSGGGLDTAAFWAATAPAGWPLLPQEPVSPAGGSESLISSDKTNPSPIWPDMESCQFTTFRF